MSIENAKQMVDLIKSDSSLASQYGNTTIGSEGKEEVLNLSLRLGAENNLSFTKEEFVEALISKGYVLEEDGALTGGDLPTYVSESGEIDEEALEAVAGGLCYSNRRGSSCTFKGW